MPTEKTLLSEGQIKEIIREEFASQGVVLTEEQLEELFGMFGKSKIIKHIMKMDPDGSKLDKMGYDSRPEALKALGKKALKGLASELQAVTGDDDEPDERKGFVQKVKDVYAGVKDIGILGGGAGTLLGGEETFDIEKRKALKDTAKKQLEGWLKKLDYKPARALYVSLQQQGFPNNDENDFMGNTAEIYNEYDKVVKDFEAKQVDCDRANTIIAVLRALVIYFQDFGMADKYFYVNEQEEPEQEEKMGAAQGSISKNFIAAYGNKLPLGLAAAGVACLAAGFAADSEFFQNFLKGFTDMEKIPGPGQVKAGVEATTGALLGNIESGEGIIKVVRRLGGPEMAQFGTAGGPGMGALAKTGKLVDLLSQAMISPQGPAALAQAIAKNANPAQLFVSGPMSGTAKAGEELFGLNKGPFNEALSGLIDSEINPLKSVPADTIKNKFLTGLGAFLGPVLKALGLSLLIAALASFTMRQKGKGKMGGSRMSKLKGIVDEMVDVPCDEKEDEKCPDGSDPPCEDEPPPPPEDPCKDKPGTTWNPETEECEEEEKKPDCDPDTQMVDPDTGECIDIPKCPDGTVYNPETGKCRRPRQLVQPQRLEITVAGESFGPALGDRPSVEKVIREFGAANGYKIDDEGLDGVLGKVEQWAEWTNLRAYGLPRNAKAQPVNPKTLIGLKEDNPLNELSPAPDSEGEETEGDPQNSFMPRSKGDVSDGKILIFVKKNGKGRTRRSLRNFLFTNIFTSQGQDTPFDRPLDRKDAKALAIAIADFVYDELEQQGGEVVQHEQQQEAKQLAESLTLDRWKVLSGIK